MKRQYIYTENDEHTKLFDSFDKLVPKKLGKGEQVEIPQTFKPYAFEKDETLKVKYKMRKIKEMKLDPVETEKQEQRTTEGTEIRGRETMLNQSKAQTDINKLFKQKRNRGGRSGGKEGGAYQGGFNYINYGKEQVKQDNEFKKKNAEQDEFRSIVEGEILNSGDNKNIVQMPE